MAINIALALFGSFLSGLMFGGLKYVIEEKIPIINRLNPATVITDALYSLNIYDTYDRYITCMITLVIYCVIFCSASYFITRRESYASL
jgi:ABC-2 type transport system permease protein